MSGEYKRTWLRFDDVTCVRCGRHCGPEGAPVYVYEGEGCVCDECHDAAANEEGTRG